MTKKSSSKKLNKTKSLTRLELWRMFKVIIDLDTCYSDSIEKGYYKRNKRLERRVESVKSLIQKHR